MKKKLKKNKRYKILNSSIKEENEKLQKNYNYKNKKRSQLNIKSKIRIRLLIPFFLLFISITLFFLYNHFKKKIENGNNKPIEYTEDIHTQEKSNPNEIISKSKPNKIIAGSNPYEVIGFDFENNTFNIITKKDCKECGFFSYYINYVGCFITSITSQRIPILDLNSFPNVFNEFNPTNPTDINPWEYFFDQPYNLTLNEVKQKAKKIDKTDCIENNMIPNFKDIYSKIYSLKFYHNFVKKYIPIKKEIMEELNKVMKNIFKKSENVLGVLAKENDDIKSKSKEYPTNIQLIEDAKKFNNQNKYDFIFLTTEDNTIKDKFIEEFGEKLKFLDKSNKNQYFNSNKISGGLENAKIYLFNIIILSKCIDIISVPTYQAATAFILSEGFRNSLVYNFVEH